MESGAFREDLYYRLCADKIVTPSLYEQISENPKNLGYVAIHRKTGRRESMAPSLTMCTIDSTQLPADYPDRAISASLSNVFAILSSA